MDINDILRGNNLDILNEIIKSGKSDILEEREKKQKEATRKKILDDLKYIFKSMEIDFDENIFSGFKITDDGYYFEIVNDGYKMKVRYRQEAGKVEFPEIVISKDGIILKRITLQKNTKIFKSLVKLVLNKYKNVEEFIDDYASAFEDNKTANIQWGDSGLENLIHSVIQSSKYRNKPSLDSLNRMKDFIYENPYGVVYNKEGNELIIYVVNTKIPKEEVVNIHENIEGVLIVPEKPISDKTIQIVGNKTEVIIGILKNFKLGKLEKKKFFSTIFLGC